MSTAGGLAAVTITPARGGDEVEIVRNLFLEYGESLDFDLCFQDFDQELAGLPGDYAPPGGELLLARVDGGPAGVVGFRPQADGICEMKRLYVRPEFRGLSLGRRLTGAILDRALKSGYGAMRLDTIGETMKTAQALYGALGFRQIPPYYENPIPGAVYYQIDLPRVA